MCQFVPALDKLPETEKKEKKKKKETNSVTLKWDLHCHLPAHLCILLTCGVINKLSSFGILYTRAYFFPWKVFTFKRRIFYMLAMCGMQQKKKKKN